MGSPSAAPTDDEFVVKVWRDIAEAHPDLVGKVARDDILAAAEEG